MEIEEMKRLWSEMSSQLEEQKKLTNSIILDMTQERYRSKFITIFNYETIGTLFCFTVAVFIIMNFAKLDTWYLVVSGIITLSFITILPVLTLRYLHRLRRFNIIDKSYKEAFVGFQKIKTRLLKIQQLAFYVSFIVLFSTAIVFAKIFSDRDFFTIEMGLKQYVSFGIAILFVFFFSRWGFRAYKKITASAENVLNELE